MWRIDGAGVALLALALPVQAASQTTHVEGVVRSSGEAVGEVVVYLESERPSEGSATRTAPRPVVIDQRNLRFQPGLLAVRPGTTVEFLNSDGVLHNVFGPGWSGEEFDLGTYPSGTTRSHVFTALGAQVILCKVHPEMVAHVVVVDTPYFGTSDAAGRFRIEDVPPGRYRLTTWRRGHGSTDRRVVVPAGGLRGLTLHLSAPGDLIPSEGG